MMAKHAIAPLASKEGQRGLPSASQETDLVDLVQLFQKLLEDEEAEEVFREFIVLWLRSSSIPD